jgi:hypothetical protein
MKTRRMMSTAMVVAAAALIFAGDSSAQGKRAGAGGDSGQAVQTRTRSMNQSMNQSANQVRPEDSRRRDGSFLSTGTTANGSTTRPANGRGLMDGTGTKHPQSTTP